MRRGSTPMWGLCISICVLLIAGCLSLSGGPASTLSFQERTNTSGIDYQTDGGGPGNGNDGVFVADYDRDGWHDLLVTGGDQPALFHNDNGTFSNATPFSGINGSVKSALWFDADGDGFEELVLFREHDRPLFVANNDGTLGSPDERFGNLSYPMGATPGDFDGDGDQDLLIYQSGDWEQTKPDGYFSLHLYLTEDNGNQNVVYENTGSGFVRRNNTGLGAVDRWSLAASTADLNGDRQPDVHVANDYNTDTVYINRGNWTFDRRDLQGNTSRNGMASEIADVNGDGSPDVFTTNIHLPLDQIDDPERYERLKLLFTYVIKSGRTKGNTLLINDGTGTLSDSAVGYRVRDGGWGWAATLTDFDLDGDRDLIHATQQVVRINKSNPEYTLPMVFERTGDRFTNRDAATLNFSEHDGRGLAALDYDRDGDQDLVVAPYDGRIRTYENTVTGGHSIGFRVTTQSGATVHGARITVTSDDETSVLHQTARTDFLSQEPRVSSIGTNDDTVTVAVRWPDGTTRTHRNVAVDRAYRITKDNLRMVGNYSDTA